MRKSAANQRRPIALSLLVLLQILHHSSSFSLRPNNLSRSPPRTSSITDSSCDIKSSLISIDAASQRRRILSPLLSSPNGGSSQNNPSTDNTSKGPKRKSTKAKQKNLYAILGATPDMPKSEIKRLYLALAKQTHPDSPNYNPETSDFSEIAAAYKILSDDKLRRRYDREQAAEEFKDDVVAYAQDLAKEYGPGARKLYEDWALPFLKRTTASTVASFSAISEVASETPNTNNGQIERVRTMGSRRGTAIEKGATLSEVVREMSEMERQNNGNRALEDFGRAFQRVIEAGRNATRQIDGIELQEKSEELRIRADEARAESLVILEQLAAMKSERLRLTFHTSSADFSSADALEFLDGFNSVDQVGIVGRMTFKHTIREDIDVFSAAEKDFQRKVQEKAEVDAQAVATAKELVNAEQNAKDAVLAETEARKRLEEAQKRVTESQARVTEAKRAVSNTNLLVKQAELEYDKSNLQLKRKRDVVRRVLRRKDDNEGDSMNTFESADDGSMRLNSAFDKSSSMGDMGFEDQNIARLDKMKRQEAEIESEFLRLVEKASRLASRSERLRLRSEELIGKQNYAEQQMEDQSNIEQGVKRSDTGTVVGEISL